MDHAAPQRTPEREAFYAELAPKHMAPLWEVLRALITREPATPCVPVLWRYDEVRPYLMRAGRLITAGPLEDVITSQHVSACFDVAVKVGCNDGRWWSRAVSP